MLCRPGVLRPRLCRCMSSAVSLLQHQRDHLVLGLRPGYKQAELKQAYRDRAWTVHPDRKAPEERHAAERAFQEISEAYHRLQSGATPYGAPLRTGHMHSYYRSRFVEFMGVHRREFEDTWAHVLRSVLCFRNAPIGHGWDCGRRRAVSMQRVR